MDKKQRPKWYATNEQIKKAFIEGKREKGINFSTLAPGQKSILFYKDMPVMEADWNNETITLYEPQGIIITKKTLAAINKMINDIFSSIKCPCFIYKGNKEWYITCSNGKYQKLDDIYGQTISNKEGI